MARTLCWGSALLAIVAFAAGTALAGPDDADCRGRNCPPSNYSRLHYWMPSLYKARAFVHPSDLNQYAPGPAPAVSPTYETHRFPCPSIPPTPTSPYADPAGYYGFQPLTPR